MTSSIRNSRTGLSRVAALLFVVLALCAAGAACAATTFFIRTDGGNATQCTGRSNVAYSGSGSAQACAWSHPFQALPPGGAARIAGGDTLIIGSGSYMMGLGASGATSCHQSYSWDCFMTAIPSGISATQPTRILGQGHDAACPSAPELWGTERASMVLNLQGSSNVEVACLEVTDHDSCVDQHCNGGNCTGEVLACNRAAAPWGRWAGVGIKASDSMKVWLRDINVHGMAHRGVLAGRLTDWTMDRMKIRANGWAGWDGDIGANSSNSGQMLFRQLDLSWNGCGERYPGGQPFGCWGQATGGYGDGLGTAATGGNWVIEDSMIHHNTSDGLDLLYMSAGGTVTVRRTWAEGNAGNQLKTKGNSLIENSVIVGNCGYFTGVGNMQSGDHCRALGSALSIGMTATSTATIVNNTISSQGDCLILSGGGGSGASLTIANNLMIGEIDYRQPSERSCAMYTEGTEQVTWDKNFVTGVKNSVCPGNSLCIGLPLVASSLYSNFNPQPLIGSPLINSSSIGRAPTLDYNRAPRDANPDIGAFEFGTQGGAPIDDIFAHNFG